MHNRARRLFTVFFPILLLVFTFVFLSGRIGFTLFPQSDKGQINISLEAKNGTDEDALEKYLPEIEKIISPYQELKVFFSEVSGNSIRIYVELLPLSERKEKDMKSSFQVENELLDALSSLESQGLKVSVKSEGGGPPVTKPVGIKIIANDVNNIAELRDTAGKFQEYLRTIP